MRIFDPRLLVLTPLSLAFAAPVMAQSAPTPAAPPQAEADQQGVLIFAPDFFAAQQPVTALDMVSRVPGFSVIDGDGSRGFQGSVGNVLINGVRPASKNDTGSSVLSRTLAAQVERIELVRGGAPGIDMQGFSVVANVITRDQSSRQSIFTGNAVLYDGGKDAFGGVWQFAAKDGDRTWGFVITEGFRVNDSRGVGPVVRRDGFGNILRSEDYFSDQKNSDTSLRVNYASPFLGGQIDLTARYGLKDLESLDLQTSPTVRREAKYQEDGSSGEFGAVFTRPLNSRLSSETRFIHEFDSTDSIAFSQTRLNNVDGLEQRFLTESEGAETILRSLLRYEHAPGLGFEAGAEIAYNMLETEQAFSSGGVPVSLPSASVKVEETRGEAFGKGTWRVSDTLAFEGGLRLERSTISQSGDANQEKTFSFIKPRLLATWTPKPSHQFRARFEREVGQLNFSDFAASSDLEEENVTGGNIDLEPEQRWIAELVYEGRFWGDGVVSVTLRHDEISDVIDVIPLEAGLSAIGNIGDGTLDRLAVNIQAPLDRFGFSGGRISARNTWNRTEVVDPTSGETRPISNVPKSRAVITIAQDIKSWNLQWSVAWTPLLGRASYDPDVQFSLRAHHLIESWVEYKPTPTWSLRAQINLLEDFDQTRIAYADRQVRPISYIETRNVEPRTFYSLRLRKTF
ncbi:TonB-dependent receptor plug domain-containing protein [Brevundimonas faecalis]|uniref:TonB-dependent receptor n=1 Tax=Brevundimonas faecalis TaxID=947378 RepID=A0ABV2RFE0_9CAUL